MKENQLPAGAQIADPVGFLTKQEVAQRLRKTPRTVEAYVRAGYIPALKIGRSILFDWTDVRAALREKFSIGRPR